MPDWATRRDDATFPMQDQSRVDHSPAVTATMADMPELTPSPKDLAAWYREAERALESRSYQRAHEWCMRILDMNPNYPPAFFVLALIAADHDNFAKAADVLARAIRLDANDPRYHAHLARCFVALNRQFDARNAARAAAALAPRDALTLDTIGVVFSRTGDHADAVPLFERAVALDAGNASYFYNLGAARQFSGDFDGAEFAYRRALELAPDLYRAQSSRVQLKRATPRAQSHSGTRSVVCTPRRRRRREAAHRPRTREGVRGSGRVRALVRLARAGASR